MRPSEAILKFIFWMEPVTETGKDKMTEYERGFVTGLKTGQKLAETAEITMEEELAPRRESNG